MKKIEPNYEDTGCSNRMGPKLRSEDERQLLIDLKFYKIDDSDLMFDWSQSCVEGYCTDILEGTVENFSGISVFNRNDELVADGWMEFIHEKDFFLVYWKFVASWNGKKKLKEKKEVGIPNHIWKKLPLEFKSKYRKIRMKK